MTRIKRSERNAWNGALAEIQGFLWWQRKDGTPAKEILSELEKHIAGLKIPLNEPVYRERK